MCGIKNRLSYSLLVLLLGLFMSVTCGCMPVTGGPVDFSAWIAYWELNGGLYEAENNKDQFSSFQFFSASFDADDKPLMQDDLSEWLVGAAEWAAENGSPELYLTVVNDILGENIKLKDPEIVSRFLATPESRAKHKDDLIALLDLGPFNGIDLDYECVKVSDWAVYLEFCVDLWQEFNARGKKLRVVLEPKREYYTIPFPEGPEYVVMAYNLFGNHTEEPGPKANPEFIVNLAKLCSSQMEILPRFAIATGGFLWRADGTVENLPERRMLEIARLEGVEPARDEDSQYMVFTYPTSSGKNDTGWYADGVTLAYMMETAMNEGFETFALWRLGGNRSTSLKRMVLEKQ